MNQKILEKNPGPFTNFLLNEKPSINLSIMRSDKSKKNNIKNKGMSGKTPNIKLVDPNASNTIKVKNSSEGLNNINLIKDSDSDSIATLEPDNESVSDDSPINSPVKMKKGFTKMPTIPNDEFKYFTNNKKHKPVIEKQESDEDEMMMMMMNIQMIIR